MKKPKTKLQSDYKRINISHVQLVCVPGCHDDKCFDEFKEVIISPDYIFANGIPICHCGIDMTLKEIKVKK